MKKAFSLILVIGVVVHEEVYGAEKATPVYRNLEQLPIIDLSKSGKKG